MAPIMTGAPDNGSLPDKSAMPPSQDAWKASARCSGVTHMMFPVGHKDITYITPAREICSQCPVTTECLDYALTFPAGDMHGVWAGMTPRQLAAEQRRRKIRPTKPTLAEMWAHLKAT
jgi:WhiB family redox-sensing transcriptional regulator